MLIFGLLNSWIPIFVQKLLLDVHHFEIWQDLNFFYIDSMMAAAGQQRAINLFFIQQQPSFIILFSSSKLPQTLKLIFHAWHINKEEDRSRRDY